MRKRIARTLALVSLLALGAHGAEAQDQTFRILASTATPGEKAQMDAALGRLKEKFIGDATFQKEIDAALAKHDIAGASALIAKAAQVRPEGVVIGAPLKTSWLDTRADGYVRFASRTTRPAPFNPWYAVVVTATKVFCVGLFSSGADECRAALRKMGYTPLN